MLNYADDDDFFTPTASTSNLANIFNSPSASDANSSGASLTYTAPRQPKVQETEPKQKTLVCVKTIHLHKLVDTAYQQFGKYGIAIIEDPNTRTHDLIIYKTKQNIISSSKLNSEFKFTLTKDASATFKDSQNQTWSVYFDETKDYGEFCKAMQGAGAQVIPHKEVEERQPKIESNRNSSLEENTVESDGAQARANILSRISKVGQSIMLPSNQHKGLDFSESDEEDVNLKKPRRKSKKPLSVDREQIQSSELPDGNQHVVPLSPSSNLGSSAYTLLNNQYIPGAIMQCLPAPMMPINDPLNVFFAENRTHNSEVRMNLSLLTNKLESVLGEIGTIKTTNESGLQKRMKELERKFDTLKGAGAPAQNDELVAKLTEELHFKNVKIAQLEEVNRIAVAELTTEIKSQQQVNEELMAKLKHYEESSEAHIKTVQDLGSKSRESANLLSELYSSLRIKDEAIEALSAKEDELKRMNQTLSETVTEAQKTIEIQKLKLSDFAADLKARPHVDKLERAKLKEDSVKAFTDAVKQSMNVMYQSVLVKYTDEDLQRTLSVLMKKATFQIINEYKGCIDKAAGNVEEDASPPPVPEFEVTV